MSDNVNIIGELQISNYWIFGLLQEHANRAEEILFPLNDYNLSESFREISSFYASFIAIHFVQENKGGKSKTSRPGPSVFLQYFFLFSCEFVFVYRYSSYLMGKKCKKYEIELI